MEYDAFRRDYINSWDSMTCELFIDSFVPLGGIGECEFVLFPVFGNGGFGFCPTDTYEWVFGIGIVESLDDGKFFLAIFTPRIKKYNEGELSGQIFVTDGFTSVHSYGKRRYFVSNN